MISLYSPGRHDQALAASEFAVPQLCELSSPSAVLGSAEWAIACQIDGLATVGELAGRTGIVLHDAMERVIRLVQAGLCTITAVAAPGRGNWQPPAGAVLPRRVSETAGAAARPASVRLDPGLLRRILDGLNSLS